MEKGYDMSQIIHLDNGTSIKNDVVQSFNEAIASEENLAKGYKTTMFWNFVHSDMYMDLSANYNHQYIDACFDKLAEELV